MHTWAQHCVYCVSLDTQGWNCEQYFHRHATGKPQSKQQATSFRSNFVSDWFEQIPSSNMLQWTSVTSHYVKWLTKPVIMRNDQFSQSFQFKQFKAFMKWLVVTCNGWNSFLNHHRHGAESVSTWNDNGNSGKMSLSKCSSCLPLVCTLIIFVMLM